MPEGFYLGRQNQHHSLSPPLRTIFHLLPVRSERRLGSGVNFCSDLSLGRAAVPSKGVCDVKNGFSVAQAPEVRVSAPWGSFCFR